MPAAGPHGTLTADAGELTPNGYRFARRRGFYTALGLCRLAPAANMPEIAAFKAWMSTWSGTGHIVAGMKRQGFVINLRRLVDDGWTARVHSYAMLAADGSGTPPAPFAAVQTAEWRARWMRW